MVLKSKENSVGAWSFLIGVILAIIIGFSASSFLPLSSLHKYNQEIYLILVILGLVVGSTIKTTGKDTQTFLYTCAILVIVSNFGLGSVKSLIGITLYGPISNIFAALLALFVPATIVVAIKSVFSIAKI